MLRAEIAALRAELARSNRKATRNSSNSSQPPSFDFGRKNRRRDKRKPSERKPGGQPGHKKASRDLKPPDEVDELQICRPEACGCCGGRLVGQDPDPWRHQVTEIPPVCPIVTEYQLHTLTCGNCGAATRAKLPEGVSEGCFGPRVQATIAQMTGVLRVSRRSVQSFLADSFGLQMSLGAISKQESIASMALIGPVSEALEYVRNADVVHADETSWRERGQRTWLWAAVTDMVATFLIRPSRGRDVAQELLGQRESGITVSDRYGAYSWIEAEHRQLCWAHLIRDFRRIEESGGKAARVGKRLLECSEELFAAWGQVRDGTLPHEKLAAVTADIPERVRKWLKKGAKCKDSGVDGLCRGILREEPSMWTFVNRPGVEPTNNDAERAIRPAVLLRKCSQGTQSYRGNLFVERLQTVSATLRRQGRNVFEYLVTALQASRLNQPAPSLLPLDR